MQSDLSLLVTATANLAEAARDEIDTLHGSSREILASLTGTCPARVGGVVVLISTSVDSGVPHPTQRTMVFDMTKRYPARGESETNRGVQFIPTAQAGGLLAPLEPRICKKPASFVLTEADQAKILSAKNLLEEVLAAVYHRTGIFVAAAQQDNATPSDEVKLNHA